MSSKDLCTRLQSIIRESFHDLLRAIHHHRLTKSSNASFFRSKKLFSRLVFTKGIRVRKNEFIKKSFLSSLFYIHVNIPSLPICRWFFFHFASFCFVVYLACIFNFFSFVPSSSSPPICVCMCTRLILYFLVDCSLFSLYTL